MHWGIGRQLVYALGALIIIGALGAGAYFGFIYKAPTCSDGRQNGTEEGVDCGGACEKLCQGPLVSVVWSRAVPVAPGIYHAVAMVRNPDTSAAGVVPYTASLFDAQNILITTREGTMTLQPGEVAPLFEASLPTGSRIPTRAFVEFGPGSWRRAERVPTPVSVMPRHSPSEVTTERVLGARVENIGSAAIPRIVVTVLLYDAASNLIAASQTTVADLKLREARDTTFTWPTAFTAPVATIDLVPRVIGE